MIGRRSLLKTTLTAGLLLTGCTTRSDESDGTRSTRTSRATTTAQPSKTPTTGSRTGTKTTTTRTQHGKNHETRTTVTESQRTETVRQQETSTTTRTTTERTTTARPTPDHPSASGVFDEPRQGPTPFSTDATLIAFEDPSCPHCATFQGKTYPKLERNYVDSGDLSFVLRTVPSAKQWGIDAIYALEATHARDADAFWELESYYFGNQDRFDTGNVLSKTKTFIDGNTRLDGEEIAHDARTKAQKAHVEEDKALAKKANLRGTPTFFAFRSGEYVTKIVGPQSYGIFKSVLGL